MTDAAIAILALGVATLAGAAKVAGFPGRLVPLLLVVLSVSLAAAPARVIDVAIMATLIVTAAWAGHHAFKLHQAGTTSARNDAKK